jgi:hypothetical protein
VAVGWQVYALTSSAFDLGMVGLLQFIPTAALILLRRCIGGEATREPRALYRGISSSDDQRGPGLGGLTYAVAPGVAIRGDGGVLVLLSAGRGPNLA